MRNVQGACAPFDELNSRIKQICAGQKLVPKDVVCLSNGVEATVYVTNVMHAWASENSDTLIRAAILVSLLVRIDGKELSITDVMSMDMRDFNSLLAAITC